MAISWLLPRFTTPSTVSASACISKNVAKCYITSWTKYTLCRSFEKACISQCLIHESISKFHVQFQHTSLSPKLIAQRSPCSVDRKIYTQKFRKQVIKSQHIIYLCYPSRMCAAWTCRHGKCTPYSDFSVRQNSTFPHYSYPDKCADFQLKSWIEVNTTHSCVEHVE